MRIKKMLPHKPPAAGLEKQQYFVVIYIHHSLAVTNKMRKVNHKNSCWQNGRLAST